ncbi:hypothetical protein EIP91_010740 [Steccherinum ochraceum]|uniref:Uncharacterized protein n=1 Tax=Steccherinum ochraceum TaxID=92696 RepID=A0A4R0RZ01_9APHY|nr:hypothetical protein EIP91_010740 [Steccherinum ochraceum]
MAPRDSTKDVVELSSCSVKITIRPSRRYKQESQYLTVSATYKGQEVGYIEGAIVDRKACRKLGQHGLHTVMSEVTNYQPRLEFWSILFDKHGYVKEALLTHDYHKGAGGWSRELDAGVLVSIENVHVKPKYRRAGIASLMLHKIMETNRFHKRDFLVACDQIPNDSANNPGQMMAMQQRYLAFLHHNRFHRVGRTPFLLYSLDPNHPIHHMPFANEPRSSVSLYEDLMNEDAATDILPGLLRDASSVEREARRFPIHHAVESGPESLPYMIPGTGPPIDTFIQQQYRQSPSSVRERNRKGFTPLHAAAAHKNLRAVRELLKPQYGALGDLDNRQNVEGVTPLEFLWLILRKERQEQEMSGITWRGYSPDAIEVAWTLRHAAGEDIGTSKKFIEKYRWGCTCGKCTEGWFSPRMRYRIRWQAGALSLRMLSSRPSFKSGIATSADLSTAIGLRYIPPSVRADVTPEFWKAYLPTPLALVQAAFLHYAGDSVDEFKDAGGKGEHALNFVLDYAEKQSALGDGSFEAFVEDPEMLDTRKTWEMLPKCENDLDFGLMRRMLRVPPDVR